MIFQDYFIILNIFLKNCNMNIKSILLFISGAFQQKLKRKNLEKLPEKVQRRRRKNSSNKAKPKKPERSLSKPSTSLTNMQSSWWRNAENLELTVLQPCKLNFDNVMLTVGKFMGSLDTKFTIHVQFFFCRSSHSFLQVSSFFLLTASQFYSFLVSKSLYPFTQNHWCRWLFELRCRFSRTPLSKFDFRLLQPKAFTKFFFKT